MIIFIYAASKSTHKQWEEERDGDGERELVKEHYWLNNTTTASQTAQINQTKITIVINRSIASSAYFRPLDLHKVCPAVAHISNYTTTIITKLYFRNFFLIVLLPALIHIQQNMK